MKKGITPAYAGNTHQWSNTAKVGRDHPRLRGEHGFRKENSSTE